MTHIIKAAFATGLRGEFGNKGDLPWGRPFKGDMEAFKEFTANCVMVMGAETFKSLPARFKSENRECVVISRTMWRNGTEPQAKNGDYANEYASVQGCDLIEVLEELKQSYGKDVCVIGGASLIEQTVPFADKVMHTLIEGKFDHDVAINPDALCIADSDKFKFNVSGVTCKREQRNGGEDNWFYTIRKLFRGKRQTTMNDWWK